MRWLVVGALFGLGCATSGPTSPVEDAPADGSVLEIADAGIGSEGGIIGRGGTAADAQLDGTLDTVPPAAIVLAAKASGVHQVRLDWDAVGDDGLIGRASLYELRYALAPITTEAEFAAATVVADPPAPVPHGSGHTMFVRGLLAGTAYHFAIRATDEAANKGPLSASVNATTPPRAQLLVSEVGVANTVASGYDFVELVAVTAGRADGLEVRDASGTLYFFSALPLAAGDRVVVHATGFPCPTGCVQEDVAANVAGSTAGSASGTAWDVYSDTEGLSGADDVISIVDDGKVMDAVALSNRDGDATMSNMKAFADVFAASQWVFGAAPVDATNDCATQRDAVSMATTDTACGGFDVSADGVSLQRSSLADTNTKQDFFAGPQTMGSANIAASAPQVTAATAPAATVVRVTFSQEIAASSVTAGAFTIAGLTVSAAALEDTNVVALTTSAQIAGGSYTVAVASTVTNLQGVGIAGTTTTPVCGFSTGLALALSEVAPNVAAQADLIELRVVSGGGLAGITVRSNPGGGTTMGTLLGTLPSICAATGDIIVLHLSSGTTAGLGPSTETTAKNQFQAASFSANYDNAWDVLGGASATLPATDVVLAVWAASGTVMLDAAAFSNMDGTSSAAYTTALTYVQTNAAWLPANCSGAPCGDGTSPTAQSLAASTAGVGTASTGNTVARNASGTDTNVAGDWAVGASTLGTAN